MFLPRSQYQYPTPLFLVLRKVKAEWPFFSAGVLTLLSLRFSHIGRYHSTATVPYPNIFYSRHIPLDEPIDLLNVAFENPRKIKILAEGNPGGLPKRQKKERLRKPDVSNKPVDTSYMVPDRIGGLQELEELRRLCPGRVWNFVGIRSLR